MNPAISIIVPVYNSDKTIRKCINSLLNQTFSNFEILLIDDGSIDSSGSICDEYAKQDYRIKVVHKSNGGVSSARQCGLDNAIGEYIIHADPDDWVDPEMLENLFNIAQKNKADMVICDYYENSYKGQKYIKQKPSSLNNKEILNDLILSKLYGFTWNKLVRRECYEKYKIIFPLGLPVLEDLYVITSLVKQEIKIIYLPIAFYHYVREDSHSSLSFRYTADSYKDDIITRDLFSELLHDTEINDLVYTIFQNRIVSHAFWAGDNFYTSKEFHKVFKDYKYSVIKGNESLFFRLCIFMACIGLYQPIKKNINILLQLKHYLFVNVAKIKIALRYKRSYL